MSRTAAPGAAFKLLSPNEAIQFILADIPVFCVGILAFGTFTFFALMKRVDRWIFVLHLPLLLSFIAAILDLSQLLVQGTTTVKGITVSSVSGLITGREVFYSFANGLRLLFYWGFVAMIPLGETIPQGNNMHSGSWRRWGLMGLLLKWSTLFLVLLTTIFQLVFRDVASLEQIGPVYEAESTLEVIISAIFILKLLLNSWARFSVKSSTQTSGKMLMQYAPIIVSLLFSLWIAVGNVILFEFTETALGRFMRAIELYIVLVYMLTVSFYHLRHLSFFPIYRPGSTNKRSSIEKLGGMMSAQSAPEPKKVDLADALQERYRGAQEIPQTMERNSARSAKVERSSQHQSMAARLSTWLGMSRPQSNNVQAWDVDTERGQSVTDAVITPWFAPTPEPTRGLTPGPEGAAVELPLDEDERRGVSPLPEYTPVEPQPKERPYTAQTQNSDDRLDKTPEPNRNRRWQDVEYSNAVRYSGVNQDVLANALSQKYYRTQDDSPVAADIQFVTPPSAEYEDSMRRPSVGGTSDYLASPLTATMTPLTRMRPLPVPGRATSMLISPITPLPTDSARSSNMSALLRRQDELDKSIAALRLFSPRQPQFTIDQAPDDAIPVPNANRLDNEPPTDEYYYRYAGEGSSMQASLGHSPLSAAIAYASSASPEVRPEADRQSSVRSEFVYDQQPPLNRSSMDSGVIPMSARMGEKAAAAAPATLGLTLGVPRGRGLESRFSDVSSVGERRGVDSVGTQYDITSFVGSLSAPVRRPTDSLGSVGSAGFSDEGTGLVDVARRAMLPMLARPTLVRQQEGGAGSSPLRRALPPIPIPLAQPGLQMQQNEQEEMEIQQPVAAVVAPGPLRFRRAVGLPANPKLGLAVRNLTPVDEKERRSSTDTATLVTSPQSGSGTPMTGKAW